MSAMELKPKYEGVSIVLLGSFNPAIFQPLWFSEYDLIRKTEAEKAQIDVIHREFSFFSVGPFGIRVFLDRFEAGTTQPQDYDALRDLVTGTFKLLAHTPLAALGINSHYHFNADEITSWPKLELGLARSSPWLNAIKDNHTRGIVTRGKRDDDRFQGHLELRLEPSVRIPDGIFINVNDHYEFGKGTNDIGADLVTDTLASQFRNSINFGQKLAKDMVINACSQAR